MEERLRLLSQSSDGHCGQSPLELLFHCSAGLLSDVKMLLIATENKT